ncbi:MAG: histidine phosphatase family protein [Betaproteobacteria bacterium]|nr:histidine phosphatase family protein [Betaproteobacteria bacterium]
MSTRICLIRHGETDWNVARRMQGHTDIPLNSTGRAQACRLAASLADEHFAAIYTSDLLRARQTAEAVAHRFALHVQPEPGLRERNYGGFQGLTYDEAKAKYPDVYARFEQRITTDAFPGGGESLEMFFERVRQTLTAIAERHPDADILVVCHGGVLDMVHRIAAALPLTRKRDFPIGNATVNWLEYDQGRWVILAWDERSHLDDSLDELPT